MDIRDPTVNLRSKRLPSLRKSQKRGNHLFKVRVQPDLDLKSNHYGSESWCIRSPRSGPKKPWYILHPHDSFRTFWDMFMLIILIWIIFYVPFHICFRSEEENQPEDINIHDLIIDIIFGVDIVLNFLTAYIDPKTKRYVFNPKLIAARYLKGFFVIDFLATVPFSYLIDNPSLGFAFVGKFGKVPKMIRILRVVRLLKLVRMYKLQKYLVALELDYGIHHGYSRLFKNMLIVLIVSHFAGCFWYLVGITSGTDKLKGWVYRYEYNNEPPYVRYVASVYWAFSTLTTVGYGDISARTASEQVFSMVTMLLGVSWYAYIVSTLSNVLANFDARNKVLKDKRISINEFLRAAKLPTSLRDKVRRFYEYKLSHSHAAFLSNNTTDQILDELNSKLRADVVLHLEKELISKIPFFRNKPAQFIADALPMFQPTIFYVGDYITKEGQQANEMYFLTKGSVAVFVNNIKVAQISEGSHFGEVGYFTGGVRQASIALTTCEVQVISRSDLYTLLVDYPQISEEISEELKEVAKTCTEAVKRTCVAGRDVVPVMYDDDSGKIKAITMMEDGAL